MNVFIMIMEVEKPYKKDFGFLSWTGALAHEFKKKD